MGETTTLADCPIGLFVHVGSGELCLKTEYGSNEGRIDAYIVASGEFFWGGPPQTIASQRAQVVRPFSLDSARAEAAEAEIARLREALEPFARVAEHDIGESESDVDRFRPMTAGNNRAPLLTVGDFRRARAALAEEGKP